MSPALKTKTAQRAKSRNKFLIATKHSQVSNNHNAHDDDDAPTNNFCPSQINNDRSYLTPENRMDPEDVIISEDARSL